MAWSSGVAAFQICNCYKAADTHNETGVETLGLGAVDLILPHHLIISLDFPFLAVFRG